MQGEHHLNQPKLLGNISAGLGLLLFIHIIGQFAVAMFFSLVHVSSMLPIGVTQLVYAVPLAWWLRRVGQVTMAKGVWIGMGITLLLSSSCLLL